MNRSDLTPSDEYRATYCPEDDKLRLYVGRVPREEYEFLRAEGWTATPKQDCNFSAVWTPARYATAIQYAQIVEDEDMGPEERAADRAERFIGYREKRTDEAGERADAFDAGPSAHGYQNAARAERAAARHDRLADKATDAWSKAEYWQRRTAGVIGHALHKSDPDTRMGRIKVLEADLRKSDKEHEEYAAKFRRVQKWAENPAAIVEAIARRFYAGDMEKGAEAVCDEVQGYGKHTNPNPDATDKAPAYRFEHLKGEHPPTVDHYLARWLATNPEPDNCPRPWAEHIRLRLAYENQMLEAQGGRAASVEMEPGGWLGNHQIYKVNKSPATGRVVSVELRYMSETNQYGRPWSDGKGARMLPVLIKTERMEKDVYRAPTDEERAAFAAQIEEQRKEAKAKSKAKKEAGDDCPLINPTDDDAEKLQEMWNEASSRRREKPGTVLRMTQAQYSASSSGSFARFGTVIMCETGNEHRTRYGRNLTRCDVLKVRKAAGGFNQTDRVIVITDKPQKPIPWRRFEEARAKCPTPDSVRAAFPDLLEMLKNHHHNHPQLIKDAEYVGWLDATCSRPTWTERGLAELQAWRDAA